MSSLSLSLSLYTHTIQDIHLYIRVHTQIQTNIQYTGAKHLLHLTTWFGVIWHACIIWHATILLLIYTGAKHLLHLTTWFGVSLSDPTQAYNELQDDNASSSATLPIILVPAPLHQDGLELISPPHGSSVTSMEEIHVSLKKKKSLSPSCIQRHGHGTNPRTWMDEIHVSMRGTSSSSTPSAFVIELYLFSYLFYFLIQVIMRVTSNSSTPSAFVIELYLGAKKAVRVFPEWQLPSLHSQGLFFYLFIYLFLYFFTLTWVCLQWQLPFLHSQGFFKKI